MGMFRLCACARPFALVVFLLTASTNGQETDDLTSKGGRCRCVPDQWQGMLSSVEREFDLLSGRTATTERLSKVYYDFRNKKLATKDLRSGHLSIQDFERGYSYLVYKGRCRARKINEPMRRMCIPDNARHIGDHTIAVNVPVEIYEFTTPWNLTTRTTVDKRNCVPLDEQLFISRQGYSSMTSSVYIDVNLSISEGDSMKPPPSCVESPEGYQRSQRWKAIKRTYDAIRANSDALQRLRMKLLSMIARSP